VSEKAGGGGRFNGSPSYADGDRNDAGRRDKAEAITRNRRSVWTITTKPYSGAHFAVMPPDLVEPCILAGTSERGCCPKCGKPWERNVGRPCHQCGSHIATQGKSCPECGAVNDWKRGRSTSDTYATTDWNTPGKGTPRKLTETGKQATVGSSQTVSIGWRPGCECYPRAGEAPECFEPAIVPCTVLDPFAESGTTLVVAAELGRNGIGIELNPEYVKLAQQRIDKMRAKAPLFDAAMQTVVTR